MIDDDDDVRLTIAGFLSASEHDVSSVSCGENALLQTEKTRFDLIITDLFMGGGDGLELIPRIRAIDSSVPIVLITGGGEVFPVGSQNLSTVVEIAQFLGASHVMFKPLRRKNFLSLIDQILGNLTEPDAENQSATISTDLQPFMIPSAGRVVYFDDRPKS